MLSPSNQTGAPLSRAWTVQMAAGEVKAFGGFTLGSFAPRKGKVASCTPVDGYKKAAAGSTLQDCFLECLVYGYMSHTIICDVFVFFCFLIYFFIRILGFVLILREHCSSSVAYATVAPPHVAVHSVFPGRGLFACQY